MQVAVMEGVGKTSAALLANSVLALLVCGITGCSSSSAVRLSEPAANDSFAELDGIAVEEILSRNCPSLTEDHRGEIIDAVRIASDTFGVEPPLIFAIITAESRCRANARSSAGALGLMQLMPKTAKWLGVTHPKTQFDNIFGGTQYVAHLLERFSELELALAAYNAGPGKVRRYGGIPPYRETKTYVKRVMGYYEQYRQANR